MARADRKFKDAKAKRESGGFAPLPYVVLRSRSYATLSPYATKLINDMLADYKGDNNGDLSIAWVLMRVRGWHSQTTLNKAKRELLDKEWIKVTRQGGRRIPSLYALTFLATDECGGKLDIAATHSPTSEWRRHEPIPKTLVKIQTAMKKETQKNNFFTPRGGAISPPLLHEVEQ